MRGKWYHSYHCSFACIGMPHSLESDYSQVITDASTSIGILGDSEAPRFDNSVQGRPSPAASVYSLHSQHKKHVQTQSRIRLPRTTNMWYSCFNERQRWWNNWCRYRRRDAFMRRWALTPWRRILGYSICPRHPLSIVCPI